ncbi:MAG: dethiobiotin synthase [Lamprobacter sp.]|uniref:dethiobiotin synthase n=1 Tax=Lamprobacter sp. TaxID=3100796 RepID=UPI002B257ED8|nr:dethiobiotin synthase [Lamprobacter sp.]MEA3640684.1 dethiobiotin synthase [Lamprobacter sp.]
MIDAVEISSASAPAKERLQPQAQGLFVTGTDTEVGKTEVTLGLMAALQRRGLSVLGMKPVAAGSVLTADGLRNEDALRIQAQGSKPLAYSAINPYAFAPPIAPHIAAAHAGVEIQLEPIKTAYARLAAQADWVLVEGAGGWRVPLGPCLTLADLPSALDLPVVLVVGLRLGCLNHALLSAESIQASGLQLAGWVANRIDPAMAAAEENLATLRERLPAPCFGVIPWLSGPTPAQVADFFSDCGADN